MRLYLCIFLLLFLFFNPVFSSVFLFEIKQGDNSAFVKWKTKAAENGIIELDSINELEKVTHKLVCDADYNTLRWSFEKKFENTNYSVEEDNGELIFRGLINGRPIDKKGECEGLAWYQFHAISLPQYLNVNVKEVKFVSIRPDDGKLFKLTAKYRGVEDISVQGESLKAMRVDVHLTGLLSGFGHVSYWFRTDDHVFVKFKGVSGFPGSSPVIYELIEMEA